MNYLEIIMRSSEDPSINTQLKYQSLSPEKISDETLYQPSSRPYTIIHMSDPHLSRQFYREHFKSFKILLRTVLERDFDHLIVTGDITSTADEDDFFLAREIFSNFGLLDSKKLTVIPGNHDIFGGPHRAIDVLSFPGHIRNVDYRYRIALFHGAFRESFDGCYFPVAGSFYPFVKQLGPFAIIGLNSVPHWSLRQNPFGSNGLLDDIQFEGLRSLIKSPLLENLIPVAVIHHHFNDMAKDASPTNSLWQKIESKTMRLRKRHKTLRLFEALNVRYILHGHIHRNELYDRNGIQCANGAGAVCDDPIPLIKYNRLRFEKGMNSIETVVLPIPYQVSTTAMSFRHRHQIIPEIAASAAG